MAKTQMQLANRAWRIETKRLGWNKSFTTRKKWKVFCRDNAAITIHERQLSGEPDFEDQGDACWEVDEELTCWTE